MLFDNCGYDTFRQSPLRASDPLKWPAGHLTLAGNDVVSCGLFGDAESPAGCGWDAVQAPLVPVMQVPGGGDWSAGQLGEVGVEERSRGRGCVVGNDRVVDEIHSQGVEQAYAAAIPSSHVVGDDVVGDADRIPVLWSDAGTGSRRCR